mgnify:CR=1 FL=1
MAHTITLIPGDGIGPEVAAATVKVIGATGVHGYVELSRRLSGPDGTTVTNVWGMVNIRSLGPNTAGAYLGRGNLLLSTLARGRGFSGVLLAVGAFALPIAAGIVTGSTLELPTRNASGPIRGPRPST